MARGVGERVALVDLDNTLADYDGAMQHELAKMRSPHDPPLPTWSRDDEPPWLEARRRLVALRPGFWRELPRLAAGFEVYNALVAIGFDIMILSKGPTTKTAAWMEKADWCAVNVPNAEVTITHRKSLTYGRVLVDDWPPYVEPWLETRPRGLVIMPAQPWNEGFTHPNVYRYADRDVLKLHRVLKAAYDRTSGEPLVLP